MNIKLILKIPLIVYVLPNSCIGFAAGVVGLATGGKVQFRRGCLEFHGGFVTWMLNRLPPFSNRPGMVAMTLGHVIIGQSQKLLDQVRDHEHVHVHQYEVWGPLFLPIYLGFSAILWLCRRDPYMDNPFEMEAYGKVDRRS